MKSNVYYRAAECIAAYKNHFSCNAIDDICGSLYSKSRENYIEVMGSNLKVSYGRRHLWVQDFEFDGTERVGEKKSRLHRTIALLFMHEYVNSEEK